MIGDQFLYRCGVDAFTGCYETIFDASHDGCKCTMLHYGMEKSLVRFNNGEEAIVNSNYLIEIINIREDGGNHMKSLSWKNSEVHGQVYCPMIDEFVKTYLVEGGQSHSAYTAPFAKEDGCVYFYKYDLNANCWHEELFYLGEYLEEIECTYEL